MFVSCCFVVAGWSSLAARRAHNPKVVGSNPTPATKSKLLIYKLKPLFLPLIIRLEIGVFVIFLNLSMEGFGQWQRPLCCHPE